MRSLTDVWSYALSNLRRHRARTVLTVCGISVGIATLTVMVSLGSGLRILASDQFNNAELITRIRVLRGGMKEAMQSRFMGGEDAQPTSPPLTDEVVEQLRDLPGVAVAYGEVQTPVTVEANGQIQKLLVEGLPVETLTGTYREATVAGSYWDDPGARAVCVLPSYVLDDLGFARPEDAIGVRVAVSSLLSRYRPVQSERPDPANPEGPPLQVTTYERPSGLDVTELDVVGVYDSADFGAAGQSIHVPLEYAEALTKKYDFRPRPEGEYVSVTVKVEDYNDLNAVRQEIEKLGYDTWTVFDVLKVIEVVFVLFQVLLSFFGGIGLVVAFFGIANTMLMAVLERTREIGVLKALGARDRDVRRLFTAEAAAIGLAGGLVGLAIGWAVGKGLNAIAGALLTSGESTLGRGLFVVEGWLALVALVAASLVAAAAGLYPAWRAARLDPVEALRRD